MIALATKYRPKTFEDVVGQENIIKILENQVKTDEIKQAYLFTGGAGTGKTTSARILANQIDAEVLEIDGASNNGVDNIREIREKLKFKPIKNKYKVLILDEVHMLSTGAFNALLKILEEPPTHAIFILATTDPQKIPSTILSRVQRFDFRRLTHYQIIERLAYIVESENLDIESQSEGTAPDEAYLHISVDALEYIAKLAQGGMRSAISILDTCIGYQKNLSYSDVIEILGSTDYDSFFSLASAIIQADYEKIITIIEEQHMKGRDLKQFVKGFTEFIVDVMKVQLTHSFDITTIPTSYTERVQKMLQHIDINQLKSWFKKMSELTLAIRYESNPKTLIEGELICL